MLYGSTAILVVFTTFSAVQIPRVVFRETIMPDINGKIFWNAADRDGEPLPTGHYIVTLQSGDLLETRAVIVAR